MPLPLSPPKKIAKLLTGNKHKRCVKELNVTFQDFNPRKKENWSFVLSKHKRTSLFGNFNFINRFIPLRLQQPEK